jgi:hypothetical protein
MEVTKIVGYDIEPSRNTRRTIVNDEFYACSAIVRSAMVALAHCLSQDFEMSAGIAARLAAGSSTSKRSATIKFILFSEQEFAAGAIVSATLVVEDEVDDSFACVEVAGAVCELIVGETFEMLAVSGQTNLKSGACGSFWSRI